MVDILCRVENVARAIRVTICLSLSISCLPSLSGGCDVAIIEEATATVTNPPTHGADRTNPPALRGDIPYYTVVCGLSRDSCICLRLALHGRLRAAAATPYLDSALERESGADLP